MAFLDLFRKKKDEREELAERVREMLSIRYPEATMIKDSPLYYRVSGGGLPELTISLENLFRQIEGSDPKDVEPFIQRYFFALTASEAEQVFPEQIIPMIKDDQYLRHAESHKINLVKEHLAADLWIIYAVDYPTRVATLKPEKLTELGLTAGELHALAIANLRKLLPSAEKHGGGEWFMVSAGNDYTSSLLLFDELWAELERHIQGSLVAVVPTRDILLVTGSDSPSGIAAVRTHARQAEQKGSYAISQSMLLRRDDRWVSFNSA